MKKAQDYVNDCKSELSQAQSALNQALSAAEKPENKSIIQDAISSLESATSCLNEYQD